MRIILICAILFSSCVRKTENVENPIENSEKDIISEESTNKMIVCDTIPTFYLDPITGNIKIEDEINCDTIEI